MKNVKKTIAAGIILTALTFGANVANAGIVIAKTESCTTPTRTRSVTDRISTMILDGIVIAKTGIVIAREGIVIAREGIVIAKESTTPCEGTATRTREGIVIA